MDILLALGIASLCCIFAGAHNWAYGLYFLSFVPFISLSAVEGGLTSTAGLGGDNVLFKLCLRAACTLGFLVVLARRRESYVHIFRATSLPVLALVCWALIWILRSQSPWISLFRLLELFSFFLGGVALWVGAGQRYPLRTLLRWHCLALWTLPLLALWFAYARPDLASHDDGGDLTRWGHKLLNANSLGFACTIVSLWATSELRTAWFHPIRGQESWKTRWLPALPLLVCIGVLLMARSRTAMLTLSLGQAILWWPRGAIGVAHARFVALALLVGAALMWQWETVQEWMLRGDSVQSLASATGRTDLWNELLVDQVPKAPVAGAGYLMLSDQGGFWHAGRVWTNAHNTYMFALVSAGIVGLVLVLTIVLLPWWTCLRLLRLRFAPDLGARTLLFALQTVLIATSITGFGVFGFPNPAMFLFYSLYALVLAYRDPAALPGSQTVEVRHSRRASYGHPLYPSLP